MKTRFWLPVGLTVFVTVIQFVVVRLEFCCSTKPVALAGHAMTNWFDAGEMLNGGNELIWVWET